jgi:hypothetical protein
MRFHSQLIAETPNSSLSVLTVAGEFVCFVLEDGFRAEKVKAETRIPPGVYKVEKRTVGGFYEQYKARFKHPFSVQVMNVPNFENILIHIGNTIYDTAGCLLVGLGVAYNGNFEVNQSTAAYSQVYEMVRDALDGGGAVEIEISRERLQNPAVAA